MPWLPRNSRALDPESINCLKLPRASSVNCSRKPPQVESHQSSQEVTSHTLDSMVSNEETCEWDRETERFRDSLTLSRVIEAKPGRTVYGPRKEEGDGIRTRKRGGRYTDQEKRRRKSYNTSDGDDWEQGETRDGLVFHKLGQSQIRVLKERPQQGGNEANEEPVKALTVACKSVKEKSCTDSGLHLPVPPRYGTPGCGKEQPETNHPDSNRPNQRNYCGRLPPHPKEWGKNDRYTVSARHRPLTRTQSQRARLR